MRYSLCFGLFLAMAMLCVGEKTDEDRGRREFVYKCFSCGTLNRYGPKCPITRFDCYECYEGYVDGRHIHGVKADKIPCFKPTVNDTVDLCSTLENCFPGFYCYKQQICRKCVDCNFFLRKQPGACVTRVSDCGDCMAGYVKPKKLPFTFCHVPQVLEEESCNGSKATLASLIILMVACLIWYYCERVLVYFRNFMVPRGEPTVRFYTDEAADADAEQGL